MIERRGTARFAALLFALLCAIPLRAAASDVDPKSAEFQRNRERWESMSPAQKDTILRNYDRWKAMPESRRRQVRERWERIRPSVARPGETAGTGIGRDRASEGHRGKMDSPRRTGKPEKMERPERGGRREKPLRPEKLERGAVGSSKEKGPRPDRGPRGKN